MVAGRFRSRTFRRIKRVTPGGECRQYYKRRMPSKAVCSCCRKVLAGVARGLPSTIRNLPKTKKRPERPFGGVLCSGCMRKLMIAKARAGLKTQ